MAKTIKIAKKANIYLVLDTIRRKKECTIEELTDETGLSRPTILNILKDLKSEGVLTTSGYAPTEIGRQPVLYTLDTDNNFAIGIDVDVPPINLIITNSKYEIVYKKTWNTDYQEQPSAITEKIIREIQKALDKLGINYHKVLGIGLGLPASIDIENNATVRLSRITNWNNYPISQVIQEQTNIGVYMRNDAHLLSIAEHKMLNKDSDSLFIVLRSGIGMAAIINNHLYEGAQGNAGYIGHTILKIGGRECDCGLKGCFETYCSKRAIVKDYLAASNEKKTYLEILKLAKKGDPNAIKVLEQAGTYLGIGISNFIKIYEIYNVIVGDIRCDADHVFFQSIIKSTKDNLKNFTNVEPKIIPGKLESDNFGLGGCYFVLGKFFAKPEMQLK